MEHYLSKFDVENLKVGDVISIIDIEQSKLKESDDRMTVMEIIQKHTGVKLKLSMKGIKYFRTKDGFMKKDKNTGEWLSKPCILKTNLSSSRMTATGKIHSHASGSNYTDVVVKPEYTEDQKCTN